MEAKYHPHFQSFSDMEIEEIFGLFKGKLGLSDDDCPVEGMDLFNLLDEAGLESLDVIMKLSSSPTTISDICLDRMMMVNPLSKKKEKKVKVRENPKSDKFKRPRGRPKGSAPDKRVITYVQTHNPKRPGSRAHDAFCLYQEGITVEEFVKRGGTKGDVVWDLRKGFIEVSGNKDGIKKEKSDAEEHL